MSEIYKFEWPVDQAGYEITRRAVSPPWPLNVVDPVTGTTFVELDIPQVVGRGGPPRCYRPMEKQHHGIWRSFAEECTSTEGVMSFVREYGLLSHGASRLDDIIHMAAIIREIAEAYDAGRLDAAASRFNRAACGGLIAPVLVKGERKVPWALRLAPRDLMGAIFLQVGDALSGGHRFQRCRNESCTTWFRVGREAATTRRAYCSDRCRAASARRQKQRASEADKARHIAPATEN
jgi:hypothetical protein